MRSKSVSDLEMKLIKPRVNIDSPGRVTKVGRGKPKTDVEVEAENPNMSAKLKKAFKSAGNNQRSVMDMVRSIERQANPPS